MSGTIKQAVTNAGETLINVPADMSILLQLGFSEEQAVALCSEAAREERLQLVIVQRMAAYRNESDPLFLEWQYEETAEHEKAWRDKVKEIKERYPLPERS